MSAPFRNISWPVTRFRFVVEYLSELASVSTWNVAVDANIKVLTVVWIRVSRMSDSDGFVDLLARECEDICRADKKEGDYVGTKKRMKAHLQMNSQLSALGRAKCRFLSSD